jgi:hypothetical protein
VAEYLAALEAEAQSQAEMGSRIASGQRRHGVASLNRPGGTPRAVHELLHHLGSTKRLAEPILKRIDSPRA